MPKKWVNHALYVTARVSTDRWDMRALTSVINSWTSSYFSGIIDRWWKQEVRNSWEEWFMAAWLWGLCMVLGHFLWVFPLFFLTAIRWAAFLPHPFTVMSLTCHRPMGMKPTDYELKPLKSGAKINLSSFKLFFSGSCPSDKKLRGWQGQQQDERAAQLL